MESGIPARSREAWLGVEYTEAEETRSAFFSSSEYNPIFLALTEAFEPLGKGRGGDQP